MSEYFKALLPHSQHNSKMLSIISLPLRLNLLIEKQSVLVNMYEIITLGSGVELGWFGQFLKTLLLSPYLCSLKNFYIHSGKSDSRSSNNLFTKGAREQRAEAPRAGVQYCRCHPEIGGFAPDQVNNDQEHCVTDDCSVLGANWCPSVPSE